MINLIRAIWWLGLVLQACIATPLDHALDTRASCNANDKNLAVLKQNVASPQLFCSFWFKVDGRKTTPFSSLDASALTSVCQCVRSNPKIVGTAVTRAIPNPITTVKDLIKLQRDVASPLPFCKFWFNWSWTRINTPFSDLTPPAISAVCKAVTATPALLNPARKTTAKTTARSTSVITSKTSTRTTVSTTSSFKKQSTTTSQTLGSLSTKLSTSRTSSMPTSTTKTSSTTLSTSRVASTSSVSATRSSSTLKSSTASISACVAESTASLVPVTNTDKNRTSLENLVPSKNITLAYANEDMTVAAAILFNMYYPTIILEDSASISSITCSNSSLTIKLASDGGAFNAIEQWSSSGIVLVTKSTSCNPTNERGVYLVSDMLSSKHTLSFSFQVVSQTWKDVADTMQISYGSVSQSSSTSALASKCTSSYSHVSSSSAPTSTASSGNSTSYDELTAGAKEIVDFLASHITYNSDGNIAVTVDPITASNMTVDPADVQASDSTLQAELAAALTKAGLDTPDFLVATASDALSDTCQTSSSTSASSNSTVTRKRDLLRRDDAWDYACEDYVTTFTGEIGEAVCAGKSLYDNRQALACFFTGCFLKQQDPPPPTTVYDFSYTGSASFGYSPRTSIVSWTDGSSLTCVNCGLSISSLVLKGTISVVLSTSELKGATITYSETSNTNLVFGLKTSRALKYNWDAAYTNKFDTVNVQNVFEIRPKIIMSMGVNFTTDSSVSFEGGAELSLSNAASTVDLSTLDVTGKQNWEPTINMINPTFSTASKVAFYPYVRRMIEVDFSILGSKVSNSAIWTAQSVLGFDSEMIDETGKTCAIDTLQLKSFVGNSNKIVFGNGYTNTLHYSSEAKEAKCFNVPSNKPSLGEIASLQQVAQEFCTAYIGYRVPTSGLYVAATVTVPSTVTVTSQSTVTSTPTTTLSSTITVTSQYVVVSSSYATEYTTGSEALKTQFLRRDVAYAAMTHPPSAISTSSEVKVDKRAANAPAFISDWPSSKISYACSQVATGTSTKTVTTGTSTSTSGAVTNTATQYVGVEGGMQTVVETQTKYRRSTTTSVTAVASTTTVASSCPLQTQVSCFTITGHGASKIEGKKLGLRDDLVSPSFASDATTAFYLTCDGALTAVPDLRVLTGGSDYIGFNYDWDDSSASTRAKCTRNMNTKQLTCTYDDSDLMYIWQPSTSLWSDDTDYYRVIPNEDPHVSMPRWSTGASDDEYQPISLTWEEVTCPCEEASDVTPAVDTATASCPGGDGTVYQTSDGVNWQIQCNTNYPNNEKSASSASSLESCIAVCDQDQTCVAVTWESSSQQCHLKSSTLVTSYQVSGTHSVIRLAGEPTDIQIIQNGDFSSGWTSWSKGGPTQGVRFNFAVSNRWGTSDPQGVINYYAPDAYYNSQAYIWQDFSDIGAGTKFLLTLDFYLNYPGAISGSMTCNVIYYVGNSVVKTATYRAGATNHVSERIAGTTSGSATRFQIFGNCYGATSAITLSFDNISLVAPYTGGS